MKKIFSLLLTISICQVLYGQGAVGIGTTTPHAPLQFANFVAERKIVLYEIGNNNHQFFGFGVSGNGELKYHTGGLYDHVFETALTDTSSLEIMRMTGYGTVGIGCIPQHRLDVHYGLPRTGSHPYNRPFYVSGDIEEGSGIEFRHSNAAQGIGFSYNTIYATGNNADQMLQFASRGNAPLKFKTNGFERMTISPDGNVGIGTNPTAQLQLSNIVQNRKIILYDEADNNNQFFGFGISWGMLRYHVNGPSSDHIFFAGSSDSTSNELMRIKGTGQVGIGVTAPQNKLDIATGPTRTGTHPSNMAAYITANLTAPGIGFEIRHYDGTVGIGLGAQTMYAAGSNDNQNLTFLAKGSTGGLILKTNLLERLVVTGSGNVGIGPSSMLNRLDINNGAGARTGTHGTGLAMYVTGDFNAASNGVEFRKNDASQGIGFGYNTIYAAGAGPFQDLNLAAKGTGNLSVSTNGVERMKINGNGFTGFNVANPMSILDVSFGPRTGVHGANNALYVTGWGEFRTADATRGLGILGNQISATGNETDVDLTLAAKGGAGDISFSTNTLQRLIIAGTGELGIGVPAPANRLDVHYGTARSGVHANGKALYVTGGGEFRSADATQGLALVSNTISATGNNTSVDLAIGAKGASGNLILNTNNTEKARITSSGAMGIGTSPLASAILDVASTTKGILIPRMSTTERNAIAAPANGLLVYDITTNSFWFRKASAWVELSDNLDTEVFRNGTDKIYMGLTDSVGIGTNNPAFKLDVRTSNLRYGLAQTDGTIQLATWLGDGGEIGTVTNHAFRLFAHDGFKQFELLPNGKIGIGLYNPLNRFDINNGAADRTGTHATNQALYVTGDFGSASNGVQFRNNDATQGIGFGYNTIYAAGTLASQDLNFNAKGAAGNITFNTNGAEKMRITGTGNVGLGITNPNAALQFSNTVTAKKVVLYDLFNNANEYNGLGVGASGSMTFQVPAESANFVFSTGAGASSSLELFKFGSVSGFLMNRNLTIDASMTVWHDVTIAGNASIAGAVTLNGSINTEAFIEPTLLNSFTNWGSGYATAAYYKDKVGVVHLRGLVNRAANHNGIVVFTLPVGYRPSTSGKLLFTTQAASGVSRFDIFPNGDVVVTAGSTGWISLDGITFRAD